MTFSEHVDYKRSLFFAGNFGTHSLTHDDDDDDDDVNDDDDDDDDDDGNKIFVYQCNHFLQGAIGFIFQYWKRIEQYLLTQVTNQKSDTRPHDQHVHHYPVKLVLNTLPHY